LAYGNRWEVYHNNLNILLNLTCDVFVGADGEDNDCQKIRKEEGMPKSWDEAI